MIDTYYQTYETNILNRIQAIVHWVVKNQDVNGGWSVDILHPEHAYYSAMAQGEAISLLARAKYLFNTSKYTDAIQKAYALLVSPTSKGGVAEQTQEGLLLYEVTDSPMILNGSIFAFWGLYDYSLLFPDDEGARKRKNDAFRAIESFLDQFDNGFWSMYNMSGDIASPFYHSLHIAQLRVLLKMYPESIRILQYVQRWERYGQLKRNKMRAFIVKAYQKLKSEQKVVIVK